MARANYYERKEVEVEVGVIDIRGGHSDKPTLVLGMSEARSLLYALRDALRAAGEEVKA